MWWDLCGLGWQKADRMFSICVIVTGGFAPFKRDGATVGQRLRSGFFITTSIFLPFGEKFLSVRYLGNTPDAGLRRGWRDALHSIRILKQFIHPSCNDVSPRAGLETRNLSLRIESEIKADYKSLRAVFPHHHRLKCVHLGTPNFV